MRTLVGRTMAAQFLGLSPRTVYALTRAGQLPAIRAGRTYKFDIQALSAWLARGTATVEPEPEPVQPPIVNDEVAELLGAILIEQREMRRTLVRLSNKLTMASRS